MASVRQMHEAAGVTHKTCARCGNYEPFDRFCKDRRRADGMHRDCLSCRRADMAVYRPNFPNYGKKQRRDRPWVQMIANARNRAQRKQLPFDLDEYRVEIEERVKKLRCEVSGVGLICGQSRNPYSPSIDRRDSSGGYTYDNIRIVAWGLNKFFAEWGEDAVRDLAIAWVRYAEKTA